METHSKAGAWDGSLTPAEIAHCFFENRTSHKVERAALDNPDLPVSFVAESLMSMAEPREDSLPFVPRSGSLA